MTGEIRIVILEIVLETFFSFIMQEIQIPYKAAAKPQHLRHMRPFFCNSYQLLFVPKRLCLAPHFIRFQGCLTLFKTIWDNQTDPKTIMNFDVPSPFKVNGSMYFKCSTGLIMLYLNSLFEVTKTSNSDSNTNHRNV